MIKVDKYQGRYLLNNTHKAIIFMMLALTALSGIAPRAWLTLGIVFCLALLTLLDKLHLALPFVIFYNNVYGVTFGLSVLRIFSILALLSLILRFNVKIKGSIKNLIPIAVYILFILLVMIPKTDSGEFLILDILSIVIASARLTKDSDELRSFFNVYVLVTLCSFITGIITSGYIGDEYNYQRFVATFEDPNYMGFFFTVAIFAIVSLKLIKYKPLRIAVIVALYAMIVATLSITAIVVNILLWAVYLMIVVKNKSRSFIFGLFVIFIAIGIFTYGAANPDAPVVGDFVARITEKMDALANGDINSATTGRTNIALHNFNYYMSLPVYSIFFGGTPVNTRFVTPPLTAVSHNEFIDMLLNIGIFGAALMVYFFISKLVKRFNTYKDNEDSESLCIVMLKFVWLFYAFTLTMFLDYRFLFIFLL